MPHFLPDAELITAYCGAYEARGCQFEVVYLPELSEYGLQMRYGANSSALPILPLPASEMESPEATERWMKHLRDEHLRNFDFILRRR
ncbi:hypothetical protein [Hymenobacter aerophilus]|uniref:hypothetical protein n=1 Tax=Hymenobacter aerophilus TaxID=119644 RepID=UPI0003790AAE|nr:hypothetical protein [Hymenobacter aerophilus]